jgi:hypothetical protein
MVKNIDAPETICKQHRGSTEPRLAKPVEFVVRCSLAYKE